MNKATGGPADIPEPMRAYVTPEGGRIRLEKTNPCIGVISIPSWKYPACKGVLNEVLHNPPRSTRTTQQGDIHSYWLWFLITDVPNDALGKGYTQSQNPPPPARDVHTIGIPARQSVTRHAYHAPYPQLRKIRNPRNVVLLRKRPQNWRGCSILRIITIRRNI